MALTTLDPKRDRNKSHRELVVEVIEAEISRDNGKLSTIIDDLTGCEGSYMGYPEDIRNGLSRFGISTGRIEQHRGIDNNLRKIQPGNRRNK